MAQRCFALCSSAPIIFLLCAMLSLNHSMAQEEKGDTSEQLSGLVNKSNNTILVEERQTPHTSSSPRCCVDSNVRCSQWQSEGKCITQAKGMMERCPKSCAFCQPEDGRSCELRQLLTMDRRNSTSPPTGMELMVLIFNVELMNVAIDEPNQLVRVTGQVVMHWTDARFSWDADEWGVQQLPYNTSDIWTPDVELALESANQPRSMVRVMSLSGNNNGYMSMRSAFILFSSKQFGYTGYPNDKQEACYRLKDGRDSSYKFVWYKLRDRLLKELKPQTTLNVNGWSVDYYTIGVGSFATNAIAIGPMGIGPLPPGPRFSNVNNEELLLCVGLKRNAIYFVSGVLIPALVTSALTLGAVLYRLSAGQPLTLAFSLLLQLASTLMFAEKLPTYIQIMPDTGKFAIFNILSTTLLFLFSLTMISYFHKPQDDGSTNEEPSKMMLLINYIVFGVFLLAYALCFTIAFVLSESDLVIGSTPNIERNIHK